jgi:hypothetical protein
MNRPSKFVLAASTLAFASAAAAGTAVAASAAVAKPAAVVAPAPGFNVTGTWSLGQSNGSTTTVTFIQDSAGNLTGTATATGGLTGTVETGAQVDGTFIIFTIDWSNAEKGEYTGALQSNHTLYGNTVALTNTASQATWYTVQTFS